MASNFFFIAWPTSYGYTQVLYDGDRVVGVATNDMGIAKDGSKKSNFQRGIELRGTIKGVLLWLEWHAAYRLHIGTTGRPILSYWSFLWGYVPNLWVKF